MTTTFCKLSSFCKLSGIDYPVIALPHCRDVVAAVARRERRPFLGVPVNQKAVA